MASSTSQVICLRTSRPPFDHTELERGAGRLRDHGEVQPRPGRRFELDDSRRQPPQNAGRLRRPTDSRRRARPGYYGAPSRISHSHASGKIQISQPAVRRETMSPSAARQVARPCGPPRRDTPAHPFSPPPSRAAPGRPSRTARSAPLAGPRTRPDQSRQSIARPWSMVQRHLSTSGTRSCGTSSASPIWQPPAAPSRSDAFTTNVLSHTPAALATLRPGGSTGEAVA